MANENTCVRCGKPCAPGEVMCPDCNQWLSQKEPGEAAKPEFAQNSKPLSSLKEQKKPEKRCIRCGGAIPSVAEFCPHCGGGQEPAASQPAPQEPVRERSGHRGLVIGLIVLVVLLAAALTVILVLGSRSGDVGQNSPEEDGAAQGDGLGVFEAGDGIVVPEEQPEETPNAEQGTEQDPEQGTEQEGEPVAVACVKCGVAIMTDTAVCPYCQWDQSVDPSTVPEEPVTASLGTAADLEGCEILPVASTSETSVVSQSGGHNNSAAVTIDGDLSTSWQEGVDGYGIGESVHYDFAEECRVKGIALWLGNWREGDWYAENGVPKMLNIYIGEQVLTVEFPHEKEVQYVVFSEPILTQVVMLEVSSAYEGSAYDDTCIAEVQICGWAE